MQLLSARFALSTTGGVRQDAAQVQSTTRRGLSQLNADPCRRVPDVVLASIATYYRRVTTTARPMGHLVGAVMAVTLVASGVQLAFASGSRGLALTGLVLCGIPILLALLRVVPNAVRLATRSDSALVQTALARSICRDHLVCLAAILGFIVVQLCAAAR